MEIGYQQTAFLESINRNVSTGNKDVRSDIKELTATTKIKALTKCLSRIYGIEEIESHPNPNLRNEVIKSGVKKSPVSSDSNSSHFNYSIFQY